MPYSYKLWFSDKIAQGTMAQDIECNRRKDSRLLGAPQQVGGLGLQVAGISRMCGDKNVFRAMALANTPCPITDLDTGRLLIGRDAFEKYRDNPEIFIVASGKHNNGTGEAVEDTGGGR